VNAVPGWNLFRPLLTGGRYTSKARDYESFPDFNTNLCFDWTLVINLLKT
jgi:hypothetical protein